MGSVINKLHGHVYQDQLYQLIVDNKGNKVEEPKHYGWMYDMDTPGFYYKNVQYNFVNKEGESVKQFDLYTITNQFTDELKNSEAKVLLHDVNSNEWYILNEKTPEAIDQILNKATTNGFVKPIENTVV